MNLSKVIGSENSGLPITVLVPPRTVTEASANVEHEEYEVTFEVEEDMEVEQIDGRMEVKPAIDVETPLQLQPVMQVLGDYHQSETVNISKEEFDDVNVVLPQEVDMNVRVEQVPQNGPILLQTVELVSMPEQNE